jgi:hypothetical protein
MFLIIQTLADLAIGNHIPGRDVSHHPIQTLADLAIGNHIPGRDVSYHLNIG